jgi:hypothetical protein
MLQKNPAEAVGFFGPSFGGEDLRHVKEPCDLHGSRNRRPN